MTKPKPKQPIVVGVNAKGELVWKKVAMAQWQRELISIAVRAAAMMCPVRYTGDFIAFWQRVKFFHETGIERDDAISADFKAYVPYQFEKKYQQKRRHHKGD